MTRAIADTGVWIALFDGRDQYHEQARGKVDILERCQIALPWPLTYETLRTRFVKNHFALGLLERFLKRPNVQFIDDSTLRQAAFNLALDSSLRHGRPLSMVDCLIRLMIDEPSIRLDYLATFNDNNFRDICQKRRVEMI